MRSTTAGICLALTVCRLGSGPNTVCVPVHFTSWPPGEAGNILLVALLRCEETDPEKHYQEKGPGSDPGNLSPDSLFLFSVFYEMDHFFKVLIEFVTMWLLFCAFMFGHWGLCAPSPWPGISPTPPAWQGGISATGPPAKSLDSLFSVMMCCLLKWNETKELKLWNYLEGSKS